MTNYLRPDEMASLSDIERSEERDNLLKKGIKTAANIATTATGIGLSAKGAQLSAKILPFLNEYIPKDLAIKGISKISPELGKFLKKGMEKGLNVQDGLNFIRDNITQQSDNKTAAKQEKNIIKQYSDQLHSFLENEISKGRPTLEAVALARVHPKFKEIVEKIEKDHKTKFADIATALFGEGASNPSGLPPAQQQPQTPQPQQSGQGQQALMAILQKIQQQRGSR